MAAVSALSIRCPIVTGIKSKSFNASTSPAVKSPSGPMAIDTVSLNVISESFCSAFG